MTHPLRVVLVGCGGISRAWLEAIRDIPDICMVGFVDINESAARSRAEQFGWMEADIGADLSAMLTAKCPDAIFDCTIPEAHVQVTLEALRYGCHVLGEKPLADSMAHARAMVAAAEAAGKTYAVIQNRRYDRTSAACAHSLSRAPSAISRQSTATSTSAHTSAASETVWSTCCYSTWRSTPSTQRG